MKKAVILFNLGGPDSLEAVEPFLFNLFNDPAIISLPTIFRYPLAKFISKKRTPVAKAIYAEMGGRSPILEETQAQANAIENNLKNEKDGYSFFFIKDSKVSTMSLFPQKKGTLWCNSVGLISKILLKPSLALPPALSAKNAIGLHS